MSAPLEAWFLGSLAENAPLVEDLLVEAFRDHVFWRRNFHPEDGQLIRESDKRSEAYEGAIDRLRQEMYRLLAQLKKGTPTFSHRHLGHMVSDVTLAGMIGYFAAMLYNPNNVTSESSPVTTDLEAQVGRQLADMLGFRQREPESWGHLASGGTVANLEALWAARALLYYPAAVGLAVRDGEAQAPVVTLADGRREAVDALSLWELFNLTPQSVLNLGEAIAAQGPEAEAAVRRLTVGHLGLLAFNARCRDVFGEEPAPPVLIVPGTKHYSWVKLPNLLGMGGGQLWQVPIDADYRMDVTALRKGLAELREARVPVLAVVGVCGSTEVGAVDDLAAIAGLRHEVRGQGQNFYFHVDAAYGGYAASLLWDRDGRLRERRAIEQQVRMLGWPSETWYESLRAIAESDSATVDPHKLGYLPYPAGAIVHRDGRIRAHLSTDAPYIFLSQDPESSHATGRSIIEGSRPGAAAAACWLSHQVVPLNETGYGAIIGQTVEGAQRVRMAMLTYSRQNRGSLLIPINAPDLNVLCFAVATPGIRDLATLNALNQEIHHHFSTISHNLVFTYDFLISQTVFELASYREALQRQVTPQLPELGFDEAFCGDETQVMVLRLALMNPFFAKGSADHDFVQQFIDALHQATARAAAQLGLTERPEVRRDSARL